MPQKTIVNHPNWFEERIGQVIASSEPRMVTREAIQDFCRSIGNEEWVHWDEERCAQAFGGIIAPMFMIPSLFPTMFFDSLDYGEQLGALFYGSDRFRLLRPLVAGSELYCEIGIAEITPKGEAITVQYDVKFFVVGDEDPVALGSFLLRYWEVKAA